MKFHKSRTKRLFLTVGFKKMFVGWKDGSVLRTLDALVEDQSLVPNIYSGPSQPPVTPALVVQVPSSGLRGYCTLRYVYSQTNTHTQVILKVIK